MEKKKKSIVFKKITVSILSILFVVCAYLPFVPKVNAQQSNVITYNSYGSTERGVDNVAFNGTTYITRSYIRFNFNGLYNGIVGINLSGASPMSAYAILPDNCHIISTSTNYIQIEFYGINQCEVSFAIASTSGVSGTFDIQSVVWNSMTFLGHSDSAQLVNIKNRLDDLKTYTDGIESLMSTNNQLLQTIATNTANGGGSSSTVTNIDINVDHIADDLNLLKASNDSILASLLSFFTNSLGQVVSIETVVSAIDDVQNQLVGVNTNLVSINTQLTNINATLNSLLTSVQGIDNAIDTISWKSYTTPSSLSYKYVSEDSWNTYTSGDLSFTSSGDIFLQIPSQAYRYPRLYRLAIPFYYYNNANNGGYSLSVVENVSSTNENVAQYYQTSSQGQIIIYFVSYSSVNSSSIYLKFHSDVKKGSLSSRGSFSLSYIEDSDIEYWQLLQYFNQYEYNNKLLERINSISVNITQNDITEMNNNITEYNSTMTDINQIENNYINNFNTLNNGIDLSNNSTPSVNLIDARTRFNGVFNDITSDLRIRGILILVLVCGVILILLGV